MLFAQALGFSASAAESPFAHEQLVGHAETIGDAIAAATWEPQTSATRISMTESPLWLRYTFDSTRKSRVFVIDNAWLQAFDVYLVSGSTVQEVYELGARRPFSNRPINSTAFAVPVANGIDAVYIHQPIRSFAVYPASLHSSASFSTHNSNLNLFHGFYYGLVLIMVLYNIGLFVGTRDRTYLAYAGYALALSALLSVGDGTGAMLLWPDSPMIGWSLAILTWGAAIMLHIEFAVRFLALKVRPLSFLRLIQMATLAATAGALILTPVFTYVFMMLLALASLGGILFYAAREARANTQARIFLAACAAVMLGTVLHSAMVSGWLEPDHRLHHALHVGSIAELVIFAFALMRRVGETQHARDQSLKRTNELARRNRELRAAKSLAEEHRQLQKSLQQAQKLKTIGQLTGGFAHDFNNILASVLGFAELARTARVQSETAKLNQYLDEIIQSGERGAALVRQLMVYSRNKPPESQQLDLGETVRDVEQLLRSSLPATVSIESIIPTPAMRMESDPEQLQQVIVNLCLNAAEAMDNRGTIRVVLETVELEGLVCSSCLTPFSGEHYAIKIEDTGPGFTGRVSDLFTPFHSTKEVGRGRGMGLSVVHGITHEHGGHVHASNRVEGGSRFVVYLPPREATAAIAAARAPRIMIIEDDPSVARYLELLLGEAEFASVTKRLPTEALESLLEEPNGYDLVITDYLMPQGTGLELADDIHAIRPDLPVVLMTGNSTNVDERLLSASGVRAVFEKPLNSELLLAKVRALLAAS